MTEIKYFFDNKNNNAFNKKKKIRVFEISCTSIMKVNSPYTKVQQKNVEEEEKVEEHKYYASRPNTILCILLAFLLSLFLLILIKTRPIKSLTEQAPVAAKLSSNYMNNYKSKIELTAHEKHNDPHIIKHLDEYTETSPNFAESSTDKLHSSVTYTGQDVKKNLDNDSNKNYKMNPVTHSNISLKTEQPQSDQLNNNVKVKDYHKLQYNKINSDRTTPEIEIKSDEPSSNPVLKDKSRSKQDTEESNAYDSNYVQKDEMKPVRPPETIAKPIVSSKPNKHVDIQKVIDTTVLSIPKYMHEIEETAESTKSFINDISGIHLMDSNIQLDNDGFLDKDSCSIEKPIKKIGFQNKDNCLDMNKHSIQDNTIKKESMKNLVEATSEQINRKVKIKSTKKTENNAKIFLEDFKDKNNQNMLTITTTEEISVDKNTKFESYPIRETQTKKFTSKVNKFDQVSGMIDQTENKNTFENYNLASKIPKCSLIIYSSQMYQNKAAVITRSRRSIRLREKSLETIGPCPWRIYSQTSFNGPQVTILGGESKSSPKTWGWRPGRIRSIKRYEPQFVLVSKKDSSCFPTSRKSS